MRARGFGLLFVAVVTAAAACGARDLDVSSVPPKVPPPPPIHRFDGPVSLNRNVDILFMVDDSSSMRLSQDHLLQNFPTLMNALKALPGGLPNLHIAVISSDMGAGDGAIAGCDATGGDHGTFQFTPRGTCAATGLQPGATFISNVGGQPNYTGDLADVFTCIAALGDGGCGFEHQFASLTRALGADGQPMPPENEGFLRPDAYLVIVMITNEDDCSASPGVDLYDVTSNLTLASQFGPPSNFRCNEFGHLCAAGGAPPAHPIRFAPGGDVNATVTYDSCTSNDAERTLLAVSDTAERLKALKADPDSQIIFAAITGPQAPYTVHWKAPSTGTGGPWPEISHSCVTSDSDFADPAVRVNQLAGQFGANGMQTSICDDDFSPALKRIAERIGDRLNHPCVVGQVAQRPGTTRDDCTVDLVTPDGAGGLTRQDVAACADTGAVGPCWSFVSGDDGQCAGRTVEITLAAGAPTPAFTNVEVQCALCTPGVTDPSRGCP